MHLYSLYKCSIYGQKRKLFATYVLDFRGQFKFGLISFHQNICVGSKKYDCFQGYCELMILFSEYIIN